MEYRTLGKSRLRVSLLGFGCGDTGGLIIRGDPGERERTVARALELGVNYFDTAPSYGQGESEIQLGQVLKRLSAEPYVGTKVGLGVLEMNDVGGAVARSLEASLRRLDREQVDLLQLHNRIGPGRSLDGAFLAVEDVVDEAVPALEKLQREGKIRFWGITGLGEIAALHRLIDAGRLDTVQVCYNLLNPSAGAVVPVDYPAQNFSGLLERAQSQNLGVIAIRALAAGALTDTEERHPTSMKRDNPITSTHGYAADVENARIFRALVRDGWAENLVEAALRFCISQMSVSTMVLGFSSLDHLEHATASVSRGSLPKEALARLPVLWQELASASGSHA